MPDFTVDIHKTRIYRYLVKDCIVPDEAMTQAYEQHDDDWLSGKDEPSDYTIDAVVFDETGAKIITYHSEMEGS